METIVNKVAESGIITLNLENFLVRDVVVFDLKPFLFMELILKEKDYRASLLQYDWSPYKDKYVVITNSADAIVPVWAYMLAATYLHEAKRIDMGQPDQIKIMWMLENIQQMDTTPFIDQRVVIKGCGEVPIPDEAYVAITHKLRPVVKSLMYGEPCSTVPLYKKKSVVNNS
jgi:Protein of unknown function (DUF2480).